MTILTGISNWTWFVINEEPARLIEHSRGTSDVHETLCNGLVRQVLRKGGRELQAGHCAGIDCRGYYGAPLDRVGYLLVRQVG